ncbi:hypothetical protein Aca07nite_05620 [Actinoplanes capillaceus]|uniref:Macro domain-containing protein n=1 Tax=Actinoplanes campanulatus TaxID=113559 RepID=A0ABQ3W8B6_9ACTN|nr:O-acetyl-ADP-ribose deacetylase [Actinoplanes capillaceus]GID43287.1 hypothetical protein Aca07nite_05620 [Actinoplanes capillaceus]
MRIDLVEGDITARSADVIVNAANSSLLGGGGVDGAIHRKGGPEILAETRMLRASRYGRGLPVGQAVATTAGRLPARWVVHTVGPVFSATEDRSELLRACYTNALQVADDLGAASVAFPLISAGVYRWPVEDAVARPSPRWAPPPRTASGQRPWSSSGPRRRLSVVRSRPLCFRDLRIGATGNGAANSLDGAAADTCPERSWSICHRCGWQIVQGRTTSAK